MKLKKNIQKDINLDEIEGYKFKIMWSTKILYTFLFISIIVILPIQLGNLFKYGKILIDLGELIASIIVSCAIIIPLYFVNKKFLGKTVAVANNRGIYTENEIILWRNIRKVQYSSPIPVRRTRDLYEIYCSISIYTDNKKYRILHAPSSMIRYIKRNKKEVVVKFNRDIILGFIICIILIIVIAIQDGGI